ncbi:hypothetical protein TraAM80_03531 [Trypanosoma rangeli]|uniref:Uncharacterized protein n=1 Tax=Trypanosoma rangeli TaxID=5698 RepID=A0A422NP16_TRYRA|nr:uncharacterized protein TraAM80_03531 [Trypanosoma rangeli]RNF07237.1 hypothetical protein TraAM80_03531 [Trypanosoma rangeli]|eukprot:RNF07237.1 hypothetical protein TraAM80_03531 [Trypanosoma rangeli]
MAAAEEDADYMCLATKLYADSKHFLAIKAYERALVQVEDAAAAAFVTSDSMTLSGHDAVAGSVLFKDFILHCNAFSVKSVATDIKVAKDFMRLCLEELLRRNYIQGNLDTDDPSQLFVPAQEDRGIAFLVSLSLNNWACLLLRSGNTTRAAAFFQMALDNAVSEEMTCIILINICALSVHNCSFSEVCERALEVLRRTEDNDEEKKERVCESTTTREDVDVLLCAFAYHYLAIAEEYLQPHEAEDHYNQAKKMLVSSPYQQWSSVIERARRQFIEIIQRRREEAVRRRELADAELEAARQVEATVRRKGGRPKSALSVPSSSKRLSRGKKHRWRNSSATNDTKDDSVELPPISEYLKQKMRIEGLTNFAVPLLRVVDVGDMVLTGNHTIDEIVFPFTEGAGSNSVAMVVLCEETPLQIVDEAEIKNIQSPRRTIWSPIAKKNDDIVIAPSPKAKQAFLPSTEVVNIMKTFMPPPLSEKSIENAQRSVAAFRKILNHRLQTLLRAEKAYKERWEATNIVGRALLIFNLAQDIVKLKASMKTKQEARRILVNASARRIVRFFRFVLKQKYFDVIPIRGKARVKYVEEKAAITLQKYARRWLATKELRRLQEQHQTKVRRVTKIQSMFHMQVTRRFYLAQQEERDKVLKRQKETVAREFAVTQIQRAYRRHAYRLHKWHEEGDLAQFTLHHFKFSREYYATLIQKTFRGFLVRRVYGPVVHAKRCYGRNCYRASLLNKCATIIQSAFRGYRIRRATRIPIQRRLQQRLLRRAREKVELQRRFQNKAAIVIQCAYRCYVARRTAARLCKVRERERLLRRNRVHVPFRLEEQVY